MIDHAIIEGPHGPELVCHATADAACHQRCSTGVCEFWEPDSCACGPLVPGENCMDVDWIEGNGLEDSSTEDDNPDVYDEDGILHYRGPVVTEWDGDPDEGCRWRLPEPASGGEHRG